MHLSEQRDTLIAYLKMKAEREDWHGVSDAANELMELEATPAQAAPYTTLDDDMHTHDTMLLNS